MNLLKEVELASTGVYLPGEAIPFEKVEGIIGDLDGAPSRIKRMIPKLKKTVTEILKAKRCYFAYDPKTKQPTENNTSMVVKAIKTALQKISMDPQEIDYLAVGMPVPDYIIPCTTPLIQEQLGIKHCSEIEIHSNCTAITKVLEAAFHALSVGRYKNAVVVYSQNPSAYLNAEYYNQEQVSIDNLLLRWFLSDCATAVVLKAQDKIDSGIKLEGVYNESVGSDLKTAMWLRIGASDFNLPKVYKEGLHHFGQDYSTVNKKAPIIGTEGLGRLMEHFKIKGEEVDHLVVTLPSYKLEDTAKEMVSKELGINPEKWFSNVEQKGYCGGGSLISSVDELIERDLFTQGKLIIGFAVESSKWMNGGFVLKNK